MLCGVESWGLWHWAAWKNSFLSTTILRVSIYVWMMEVGRVIFSQAAQLGLVAGRGHVIHIISLFNISAVPHRRIHTQDPHTVVCRLFLQTLIWLGRSQCIVGSANAVRLQDWPPSEMRSKKACLTVWSCLWPTWQLPTKEAEKLDQESFQFRLLVSQIKQWVWTHK